MSKKLTKIFMGVSILFMLLETISLIISPSLNYETGNSEKPKAIVWSAIFWLSLIISWALLFVAYALSKKKYTISGLPGIITFFSNPIAKIIDILMIVLLVLAIIFLIALSNTTVQVVFISLFIFAFQLHIVANSKLYKYTLKNKRKGD